MDDILKIKFNYQSNYGFGYDYSGFSLFDSIYLENLTSKPLDGLKIRIITTPEYVLSGEGVVSFLAPSGHRLLSCDWVKYDRSYLATLTSPTTLNGRILVSDATDQLLQSLDFSLQLLPYDYFPGLSLVPEAISFFVTPQEEELSEFDEYFSPYDPILFIKKIYQVLKEKQIKFSSEDYFDSAAKKIKLCERVLYDQSANSLEIGLLFASVCERAGLSPLLMFAPQGKVYAGIKLDLSNKPLLFDFSKELLQNDRNIFIDCSFFAYGSEYTDEEALFHTRNNLSLSDRKMLVLDLAKARECHLNPLPNRKLENGLFTLSNEKATGSASFSGYYARMKEFSEDARITALLTGKKLPITALHKTNLDFIYELDVNQNKILNKILSNDLTLISAQNGSGVSTLFSYAAQYEMKNNRRVLYISDRKYHFDQFRKISSRHFDPTFVLDLSTDLKKTHRKEDFTGIFSSHEDLFQDRDLLKKTLSEINSYYRDLEGDKEIVSSFLLAADRYQQLRDANDSIIFSPEQIGHLSDDTVQEWFSVVNETVRAVSEIDSVHAHPLSLIRHKDFSYEYKSQLIRSLEELLRVVENLISERDHICVYFPSLNGMGPLWALRAFNDLTALFAEFKNVPISFFEDPEHIDESFQTVTRLIQAKKENDVIAQTIRVSFDEKIFELDAIDLYSRYNSYAQDRSLRGISQRRAILKTAKRFLLPNCDVENIEYILSRLALFQKNQSQINQEKETAFRLLCVPMDSGEEAWGQLQEATDLCYQCYYIFQNYFSNENLFEFVCDFCKAIESPGFSEKAKRLRELETRYKDAVNSFDLITENHIEHCYAPNDSDYFNTLYQSLSSILSSVDQIKGWCAWLSLRERALLLGMKNMVISLESGRIVASELKRGFLRAFFKAVCEYNFIARPNLLPERFHPEEAKTAARNAMKSIREKKKSELDSVLSVNRFDSLRDLPDQFSPEELFDQKNPQIFSYYPCIISDVSIAKRLFSTEKKCFDLILIESRNAISVDDFLWLLSAGKKVAFAGLHSSDLTKREFRFDLNASAFDCLWNAVDEKYRMSAVYSQSPALAAVQSSYASSIHSTSRLYSPPMPVAAKTIDLIRINGAYGTEYPEANLQEAQYIVDQLAHLAMNGNQDSISCVCATSQQKNLILRLLALKMRHDSELASRLSDSMHIFISALNEELHFVDRVFFSLTFSPDRSRHGSRLPYEFLTFAGNDPKKSILNLLASAQKNITIVASFDFEELRHTPSILPAPIAVKNLLLEAVAPVSNATYQIAEELYDSVILQSVSSDLIQRGYRVVSGVMNGRYYIDLAVVNDNDEFILGIISDQTVLNQKSNLSAIEISNLAIYESLGWNICRCFVTCAFDSYDAQLNRILSYLSNSTDESELI